MAIPQTVLEAPARHPLPVIQLRPFGSRMAALTLRTMPRTLRRSPRTPGTVCRPPHHARLILLRRCKTLSSCFGTSLYRYTWIGSRRRASDIGFSTDNALNYWTGSATKKHRKHKGIICNSLICALCAFLWRFLSDSVADVRKSIRLPPVQPLA